MNTMQLMADTRGKLKGREGEVLQALYQSTATRGRMPTTKELCHDVGIHRGTSQRVINRLVKKGYIAKQPHGTLRVQILEMPLPHRAGSE